MADLEHMHPIFRERLATACAATGALVLSGGRSTERQRELYNAFLRGAGNPANPPGTSWHEYGDGLPSGPWALAADLTGDYRPIVRRAKEFGLCFPIASESWHVQPIEITEPARIRGAEHRLAHISSPPTDTYDLKGRTMLVLDSAITTHKIGTFAGKTLDVSGAAIADRSPVVQFRATGAANQDWYLDLCGADVYRIIARHSGRVLDLAGPGPAGSAVQQFAWAAVDNQRWRIEEAAGGGVVIASVWNPDLVLDVAGNSTADGAPIVVWHRNGGANQRFELSRP